MGDAEIENTLAQTAELKVLCVALITQVDKGKYISPLGVSGGLKELQC